MKIIVLGSISFIEQMRKVRDELQKMGHEVVLPPSAILNQTKDYWGSVKISNINEFIKVGRERNVLYFNEIKFADAVLVINLRKKGVDGYIGANTLMELAIAFEHKKKIFFYSSPQKGSFAEDELMYINPIVINSDLTKIK